jgi:hypothetical protein
MATVGRGKSGWRSLHGLPQKSSLPPTNKKSVIVTFGEYAVIFVFEVFSVKFRLRRNHVWHRLLHFDGIRLRLVEQNKSIRQMPT